MSWGEGTASHHSGRRILNGKVLFFQKSGSFKVVNGSRGFAKGDILLVFGGFYPVSGRGSRNFTNDFEQIGCLRLKGLSQGQELTVLRDVFGDNV